MIHAKNLYNDYVYFWRWALWKVFEANDQNSAGIVSFITASSYLRGPGFAGMRSVMRRTFDELWIIDLEGDSLGARKTNNVFAIQTPVAIAIGVRYREPQPNEPAKVHFTRVEGTEEEKLHVLTNINTFSDLEWKDCPTGWNDLFLPVSDSDYWKWPKLTDLFPWQENGVQFKRKWPIGENIEVLQMRWRELIKFHNSGLTQQKLFRETDARKISKKYSSLNDREDFLIPIMYLTSSDLPTCPIRYAYRSFDRQWAVLDNRVVDRPRPNLIRSDSNCQVYMISLLTKVLGEGQSAVATQLIPDLDSFCNRGGKDVIPLWKNSEATQPNITDGVLNNINTILKKEISPEDFFSYCYAILATPKYVKQFWYELEVPGPRIPITKDADLFERVVAAGRKLIWLHTYGERFIPPGKKAGKIPTGTARCRVGTPTIIADYPTKFSYDLGTQELHVGTGIFENVRQEIWNFSISGFYVVQSWLAYRMKEGAGKKSSPLDDIRPQSWQFDNELLDLLWVLDATVDLLPDIASLFYEVITSHLFKADDFPQPTDLERKASSIEAGQLPLFDQEEQDN